MINQSPRLFLEIAQRSARPGRVNQQLSLIKKILGKSAVLWDATTPIKTVLLLVFRHSRRNCQKWLLRTAKSRDNRNYLQMLDRLGLGSSDRKNQDLRFCKCHPLEEKRFSIKYTIRNGDEEGKINETFSATEAH
jgi:hypothetical protein